MAMPTRMSRSMGNRLELVWVDHSMHLSPARWTCDSGREIVPKLVAPPCLLQVVRKGLGLYSITLARPLQHRDSVTGSSQTLSALPELSNPPLLRSERSPTQAGNAAGCPQTGNSRLLELVTCLCHWTAVMSAADCTLRHTPPSPAFPHARVFRDRRRSTFAMAVSRPSWLESRSTIQ